MIGLGFLLRIAQVVIYLAVFLALTALVWYAISWSVRQWIDSLSDTQRENWRWLANKFPKRK